MFRMDLTDEEIREQCKSLGIKIGPITGTTRKIYIRKIEKAKPTIGTQPAEPSRPFVEPNRILKQSKIPLPRRNSITESHPVTNGHPKKTTRSTANTELLESEKTDLDQTRTVISKSNNHSEPRENQENELDLESMTNDQLADFMRKIGLRFASIDSRNRPNYYKRIRQKLGEKQKETYQEFSTDDDDINLGKPVQPKVQPLKAPNSRNLPPRQRQIIIDDFSSSSSEDEHSNNREDEEDVCTGVGTSMLYPYSGDDTILDTPERAPKKRNVLTQIESNKTKTKETSVPKPSTFSSQNKDDFKFTSPLVTNSISTSTENDRLPPIIKARTPLREGHEPSKKPSPREKRKIDPNEIVTQAQSSSVPTAQPISKKMRSQVMNQRVPQSNPDLVELEIANYLPKIGIACFFVIVSLYIQKTWDTAHNFLSNLLPRIDELDESPDEVVDISSEKITSVASNVGETLNKMFMKLNDEIVDAKCDFGNVISAKEKPFVRFTEFEVADELKDTVIDEFNKYSEIFQFKNNAGEETTHLNQDGFVSIEDEKLQISSYCRFVVFTTDNFTLIATSVAIIFVTWISNFLYSRFQKRREEFKELTNRMAKETIDVLQSHAARSGHVGIKKESVRDQVVLMGDDPQYWIEVERILKRDSRLQANSVIENGEEFEVWKWQETTINGELCQGQAFASRASRAAGECLKVRNMFEKNDPTIDLERYKRIIFEWCNGVNGILHVDIDPSEGWLYVKCKNKDSAGQAFSRINAQWYNRKMLAVSYIKSRRYEQRFPHSKGANEIIC